MRWFKSAKSMMLFISAALLTFSVNASQTTNSNGYKLPDRTRLATIPHATSPYRMRWLLDCDSVPASCLLPTSSLFTPWQDIGAPFGFTQWSPVAQTQTSDFTQTRNYQQRQERYEQKRFRHKESGAYSNDGLPVRHEQDVTRTDSRIVDVDYSTWSNDGPNHSCEAWTPAPNTIPWGQTFEQTRGCLEPETRDRIYTAEGSEIAREIERRNISATETRQQTGLDDFIARTEADPAPAWVDYGTKTCGQWTPATSTVWNDETFEQTRDCSIGQERIISYYDYWASDAPRTLNRTERETQVRDFKETQDVTGTKVLWSPTTDGFSEWQDDGVASYTSWSPNMATQTSDYTQSRTKTQPQTRQRYTREVNNRDGSFRNVSSVTEHRNVSTPEARTVKVTATPWADTTRVSHTAWTPVVGSQTANFTQSRGYTQNQTRDWEHRVGTTRMYTRPENRALNSQSETRSVTVSSTPWAYTSGEKSVSAWSPAAAGQTADYTQTQTYQRDRARTWTYSVGGTKIHDRVQSETQDLNRNRSVDVSVNSWSDTTRTEVTSWSPAASGQTSNFTQSRGYTQNQTRTWTHKVGASSIHTRVENRAIPSQSETRSVTVSSTPWAYTSGEKSVSAWSPAAAGQTADYTQTQTYQRDRARTWTYSVSGTKIHDRVQSETEDLSRNRSVDVSVNNWSDTTRTEVTSWSPAASGQTANFTQSRGYTQNQTRTWIHKVGASSIHTRVENRAIPSQSETRSVTVTSTPWAYTSGEKSVSAWSPAAAGQTADYTQTQTYKRDRARTWTYSVGGTKIYDRVQNETQDLSRNRSVDVSVNNWSDTTRTGHSGWSPAASSQTSSFDQSRGYTQNQTRTWTHKVGASSIHTRAENRAVSGQTETRRVTVTSGAWVYTSGEKSVSAWSPAAAGQTADYTQTQTYQRDRARTWTYSVGGTKIHDRVENGTENLSRNRTVDVSVSNWSDTTRTGHSSWSPTPSTQTSNFTQSRGYTQNQTRTWTHKVGASAIHTRAENRAVSGQSESRTVNVSVGGWSYTSGGYSYGSYSPAYGNQTANYTQSRPYKRNRTRTWTYKVGTTTLHTRAENGVADLTDSRTVTVTNTGWSDTTRSGHSSWSPAAATQTSNFTQSRGYTQNQELTYIHKVGTSTVHTRKITRGVSGQSESRTISVTNSGWQYVKNHTFTSWSPAASNQTSNFNQSRTYKRDEKLTWTYKAGTETVHTRTQNRTLDRSQTRPVAVSVGSWSFTSGEKNTGSWSPAAGNQTADYTQTQAFQRDRARTWTYKESGNTIHTRVENGVANLSRSRTIDVSVGGWSNTTQSSHTSWTPAASSQTSNFTQSRTYTQNRARTWTHKVGTSTIHTRVENGSLTNQTQSRTIAVSVGGWSYTSGGYSYGSYSPAHGTQTSDYTQSRPYKRNQTRTWTYKSGTTTVHTRAENGVANLTDSRTVTVTDSGWRDTDRSGYTSWTPAASSQTSNFTQSRSYTQNQERIFTHKVGSSTVHTYKPTRPIANRTESRTVTVTNTGWQSVKTHSHGSFTPAASTQTADFTQTRPYKRDRKRTWYYKVGSTDVRSPRVETDTINETQSRTVDVSVGGWAWDGDNYGFTSWSPAAYRQKSNYTQSRSYKRDRKRTWTYVAWSSNIHTRVESDVVTTPQSRAITVTNTGWVDSGRVDITAWSPVASSQTSDFTQTRTYTQNKKITYTHKSGSTTILSFTENSSDRNISQSRRVDVSVSGWTWTSGGYDHGSYTPAYGTQTSNYTQTRPYKRNRTRTWNYVVSGSSIHTRPENNVANLSQPRTVTVTGSGWYDWYRDSHTAWSPAYGSQTSNYTQTRHYRQWKKYTYTHKVGTTTVHTRDVESYDSWVPETRTVSVTWSGWSNGTPTYTSWSPDTSTRWEDETFTQTRTKTTPQTGKYTHKVGSTTVHTRNVSNSASETQTQSARGTKKIYSGTVQTQCSAWVNDGSAQYSSYSPSYSSRGYNTSDYTQTRTKSQPQKRTCYDRQYNDKYNRWDRKSPDVIKTQTVSTSESRTIYVTETSYADTSYRHSYGTWTTSGAPAGQERRSYKQQQKRTISHRTGSSSGTSQHNVTQYRDVTKYEYRNAGPECRNDSNNNWLFTGGQYYSKTTVKWNGSTIYSKEYTSVTSVVVDGYTYSKNGSGSNTPVGVCRVKN